MVEASLRAMIADLVGEELDGPPRRLAEDVARKLAIGEVAPARDHEGRHLAIYRLDEHRTFSVPDACPHDGGPLSTGFVEDGVLVCARHGWEFDGVTGACPGRRAGLCPRQLRGSGES